MPIKVLFFGKLGEIPGVKSLEMDDLDNTDDLLSRLHKDYPALQKMSFLVAVDKQIIQTNTILKNDSTVALLPPYAGG